MLIQIWLNESAKIRIYWAKLIFIKFAPIFIIINLYIYTMWIKFYLILQTYEIFYNLTLPEKLKKYSVCFTHIHTARLQAELPWKLDIPVSQKLVNFATLQMLRVLQFWILCWRLLYTRNSSDREHLSAARRRIFYLTFLSVRKI